MREPDRVEWSVPCRDATGRERALHVRLASSTRMSITLPAGEAAVLDFDGCVELLHAIGQVIGRMQPPGRRPGAGGPT